MLRASSITQTYQRTIYPKDAPPYNINEVSHYEPGKLGEIPKYGWEIVEEIIILTEPQLIACIKFRDYGTVWIVSHLTEIRFENSNYLELRNIRKAENVNHKK